MKIDRQELEELVWTEDVRPVYDKYWANKDPNADPEAGSNADSDDEGYFEKFSRAVVSPEIFAEFGSIGRRVAIGSLAESDKIKSAHTVLYTSGVNIQKGNSMRVNPSQLLDFGELIDATAPHDPEITDVLETVNAQILLAATLSLWFEDLNSYEEGHELLKMIEETHGAEAILNQAVFNSWITCCIAEGGGLKPGREYPTIEQCVAILREMQKREIPIGANTYMALLSVLKDEKMQTFKAEYGLEFNLFDAAINPESFAILFQVCSSFDECVILYKKMCMEKIAVLQSVFMNWLRCCETAEQDTVVFDRLLNGSRGEMPEIFLKEYLKTTFEDPERFATAVYNLYRVKSLSKIFTFETFSFVDFSPENALNAARCMEKHAPDLRETYKFFTANPGAKKYSGTEFGALMRVYDYLLSEARDLPGVEYVEAKDLEKNAA